MFINIIENRLLKALFFCIILRLEYHFILLSHMKDNYGILDYKCGPHPRILFLNREFRRATNMADMVDATKKLGLNNTIIEMVKFETMTIPEQIKKVSI